MPLQPAWSKGWGPYSAFESFPLCYTAGRHEGAGREAKVELMKEPADRAVLLLQKVSELLLESRAIVKELEAVPDRESSGDGANRRRTRQYDPARVGCTQEIPRAGGDTRGPVA